MRHRVYGKKLGRNKNERTALFKSLVQSLFTYGTIETSEEKAKAVKGLVDKIINLAKEKNTQRLLQSYLINKNLQMRLIKEIAPKMASRTSGYTSMVRLGSRLGDQAMMVKMSLIGAEQLSVLGPQLSDKGKSVVSQSVKTRKRQTDKLKTDKPESENRKQKTDNRRKAAAKRTSRRSK